MDILDELDLISDELKQNIIDWIYRLQIVPKSSESIQCGGFEGSSTLNTKDHSDECGLNHYRWGHLAMTYTAIAILVTLGDDLSRLDRRAIVDGIATVQRDDGSFSASIEGNEHDMRFVYCAAVICSMLNDWGRVNKISMADYILKSVRYDYGISQDYEMESHGGTTFCAIASLELSGQLNLLKSKEIERMKRWLLFRQVDGFQGRPNKAVDTCYSFWIGATLKILNCFELSDYEKNRDYVLSTQDHIVGGFSKWPGSNTDPFHTYFGICGLSFVNEPNILEIVPTLNISVRAYERLKHIHMMWEKQEDNST